MICRFFGRPYDCIRGESWQDRVNECQLFNILPSLLHRKSWAGTFANLPSGRRPGSMERSCRLDYVSRVASDLSGRLDPPMASGVVGLLAWHFSSDRTGDWKLNREISIGVR
jgi:hypothetical protein